MKRRLTIARALINEPSILLLDEPTTGLDPQARHLLWERLYRLKQRGVTLVLTTHYMDEAEQLCDRLVVMDKAKIVAEGSPRQLIERYATREVTELRFPVGVQETLDGQLDGLGERIEHLPDRVLVYSDDGEAAAVAAHQRGPRAGDGPRPAEQPRGRLPAAHRPDPGGLMAVVEAPLGGPGAPTSRHRPLHGPRDPRRVRAPVAALRPDLARLHLRQLRPAGPVPRRDGHRPRVVRGRRLGRGGAGRRAVPRSSSRPALLVSTVMQGSVFEATFPVLAGFHWIRRFHAMYATPLTPFAIAFAQIAWIATRATLVGSIFCVVIIAVRGRGDARHRPGRAGGDPDRARVRGADRRLHVDASATRARSTRSGASGSRRCSCSRGRSSRSSSCPRSSSRSPGCCRCGTAWTSARALALGTVMDNPPLDARPPRRSSRRARSWACTRPS